MKILKMQWTQHQPVISPIKLNNDNRNCGSGDSLPKAVGRSTTYHLYKLWLWNDIQYMSQYRCVHSQNIVQGIEHELY